MTAPSRSQPDCHAVLFGDVLPAAFVATWVPAFLWLVSAVDAVLIVGRVN